MGVSKWDSRVLSDHPAVNLSPTTFGPRQLLYMVHTDLEITDSDDVANLHAAMANKHNFTAIVPGFLERWTMPADPGRTIDGLDVIADRIRQGQLRRTRNWRFAVVPPVRRTDFTVLEISLVMNLTELFAGDPNLEVVYEGLREAGNNSQFFNALGLVAAKVGSDVNAAHFPGAVDLLRAVFVPLPGGQTAS